MRRNHLNSFATLAVAVALTLPFAARAGSDAGQEPDETRPGQVAPAQPAGHAGDRDQSRPEPPPTGFTRARQNAIDPAIAAERANVAAARSIRRALDKDAVLAHAQVAVTPDEKRVLVHGTVPTGDEKNAIIHAADTAAPTANIDFEIRVRHR